VLIDLDDLQIKTNDLFRMTHQTTSGK